MRRKKKLLALVSLLVLIVFIMTLLSALFVNLSNAASTTSLNRQLIEAQNQRKEAQKQLSGVQGQKKVAQEDKAKIDTEVASLGSQISAVQSQINESNAKISQKEVELSQAEEQCKKQFESFKTRARIMYENGTTTYFEILFGSSDFSDFISNVEIVKSLLDYDNKVLEERKAVREKIAQQKADIENDRNEQATRKATLAEMKSTLVVKQESQRQIVSQLASQETVIQQQIKEQEAEETRVENLIKQALIKQQQEEAERLRQQKAQGSSKPSTGTTKGTGTMQWPCPSARIVTSGFGNRFHPIDKVYKNHTGIDIGGAFGADIVAADSGTILFSGNSSSYGKYVVISHGNGITTLYAHCSSLLVSAGASVSKGQTIAKVGSTGNSTGPHLHFEVSVNGARQNPLNYVN
ncbi:MAG: peptidoglycan DD-metalloendopeptidase family protein [Bacillota bacterium]|nr:peptidoglycan DD-metalloendopeptidase family protein [Bacillota bacterium]